MSESEKIVVENAPEGSSDAPPQLAGPREVPVLPVRHTVLFPFAILPINVGRERSLALLNDVMNGDRTLAVFAQLDGNEDDPPPEAVHEIGTLATVLRMVRFADNRVSVLLQGSTRIRRGETTATEPYLKARVEPLRDIELDDVQTEALAKAVIEQFQKVVAFSPSVPDEAVTAARNQPTSGRIGDFIVSLLDLPAEDKQKLLEILDVKNRLETLSEILARELQVLQVGQQIQESMRESIDQHQKEFLLRQQMEAIRKELGETDETSQELEELRARIDGAGMPDDVRKEADREFARLQRMPPQAAEYTVARTYLEWLCDMPWAVATEDDLDPTHARQVLDEDHFGLDKIKERILEYLVVRRYKKDARTPILCFVGPPGTGKTSLGRSIARAIGRKFVRQSMGGVRDEAEIRGHRRTYIGALPGTIVRGIKRAGSRNPLFMLDEIDKLGADWRGDPSSALLEVLDPEQNSAFNDHYLDLDYDLSDVLFITTANNLYNIPLPLQDRMEIIRLPGYTEVEKLAIAKDFLMKRQLEQNGLESRNLVMSDGAILAVIRNYTREAGVRSLERELSSICRKIAKEVVQKGSDTRVRISAQAVPKYLGVMQYRHGQTEEEDQVGLTTGLAWTDVGGELLQTEATIFPGRGSLILTGKLGEVMQESARAALSYIRSRARQLGLPDNFYDTIDIHVHVPEGAVPKDGPSAGITIAVSMVSALIRRPVNRDVAMTGEITLRGRVLPIGGLKEKVLAAHRGGIRKVLIPLENKRDIEEIPRRILRKVELVPVSHVDEVLKEALVLNEGETLFSKAEPCDPFCPTEPKEGRDAGRVVVTAH